jgi:hypothetical protein
MSTTTVAIDGTTLAMSQHDAWPMRLSLRRDGISTFTIMQRLGQLSNKPDWMWKPVTLSIDGTLQFSGDIVDDAVSYTDVGWIVAWQCRDLRYRGDRLPYRDSNSLTDSSVWNLPGDDRNWIASRAGKSIGEIIAAVLTMDDNATALDAKGIGSYADDDPWTLPSSTLADLAALTLIPPNPVYVGGERLLSVVEGILSGWAPNHSMVILPDGTIRFLDRRSTTEHTFTMETDPIDPTSLSLTRSVADCASRAVINGQPIAEPKLVTLSSGGLAEDFAYGSYDNAGAKSHYNPADEALDQAARSQGTCSISDTVTAVLTADPNTQAWDEDEWDQDHRMGVLYLWYSSGSGIDQFVARRVVSNTAKTSGGTSTFTLDSALPATNYDHYVLYGISSGASLVYRKYKVVDPDIAAAMTRQFTYGAVWVGASGNLATVTSAPMGSVCWSASGDPPYQEQTIPFTFDPSTGNIIFATSTYKIAGNHVPSDVRVLLAVNTGVLTSVKPSSGYEGTSYSVAGMEETKTVQASGWRDPANQSAMDSYAQDLLDSIKDVVIEGTVVYRGLFADALSWGLGVSITGSAYTTGWEGLNIPVVGVDVTWNSGSPWHYTTTMAVSNRRSRLTSGAILPPERPSGQFDSGTFGGDGNYREFNRMMFGDDSSRRPWPPDATGLGDGL